MLIISKKSTNTYFLSSIYKQNDVYDFTCEIESCIGVIYAPRISLYVFKSILVLLTVIEAMNKILGKYPLFQ